MQNNTQLFLQRSIILRGVYTAIFIMVLSVVLNFVFGRDASAGATLETFIWPAIFSIGLGAFASWQALVTAKKAFTKQLKDYYWYIEIPAESLSQEVRRNFDDYEIQLVARGYRSLGNFTTSNMHAALTGAVRVFTNVENSQIVEVQQIGTVKPIPGIVDSVHGVYFSVASYLAGRVYVCVTDHAVLAPNYICRGDYTAVASYPQMPLLELLEKHHRLLAFLTEKTQQTVSQDLTLARVIAAGRERQYQANARITPMSAWQLLGLVDQFQAEPKTQWSQSGEAIKALIPRSFAEFETGLETAAYFSPAPVVWLSPSTSQKLSNVPHSPESSDAPAMASAAAGDLTNTTTNDAAHTTQYEDHMTPQIDSATMEKIASSANWFYWIAGLTIVGVVASLFGSGWRFAIGLGLTEVLIAFATPGDDAPVAAGVMIALWLLAAASVALFLWLGYVARRPSQNAFVVGLVVYAIDTLIFVFVGDWLGVILHAVALYFLWQGLMLVRQAR